MGKEEQIYVMIEDIDKEGNVIFDFADAIDYEKFLSKITLKKRKGRGSMVILRNYINANNKRNGLRRGSHYILNPAGLQKIIERLKEYDSFLIGFQASEITYPELFLKSNKRFNRYHVK